MKRKKYKPKPIRAPKLVLQHNDFEQIDRLMLMIENESVLSANGDVFMITTENEAYMVAPALSALCDYWQDLASKRGITFDDNALRLLINKINHDMPITQSLIEQAKRVINIQRSLFMTTAHNLISQLAIQHQIALAQEVRC